MENFTTISVANSTFLHSDLDVHISTGAWLILILMAILILPIVILNIIVVVVILKHKPIRTGSYLLIVSLATADACIGLFLIPGRISGNFSEWAIGDIICKMCAYCSFLSEAASVVSLSAISFDRVRAVVWPFRPKLINKKTCWIIICAWLIGMVYGLRGGFTFALKAFQVKSNKTDVKAPGMCVMVAHDDVVRLALITLDFMFLFIIPAVIVTVCYLIILWATRKHMKRMGAVRSDSNNLRQKKIKAVRMSLLMISIFVVFHLPKHAMLVYASSDSVAMEHSGILMNCFFILSFVNSVLNPILYGFLNVKIRNGFYKICKPRLCKPMSRCWLNTRRRFTHTDSYTESGSCRIEVLHNNNQTPEVSSGENEGDSTPKNSTRE